MKKALITIFACCGFYSNSYSQPNILDSYVGAVVTPTVIAGANNQINEPQDLDFKPNTHELWIANRGDANGGSSVIIYNAGLPNQSSEHRKDSHSGHFMIYPSAFAFGDDGKWTCVSEIQNTAAPSSTFMGPALWSSDTAIFARVFQNNWVSGLPLGSHYDMLHQSPFAMGIAHDSAMAYWVNDGHNGNICLYDFVQDHGPGYDDHSAGKIWRYLDVTVTRVPDVPSHMILDKATGWLYFVDGGPRKIKRLNTNSGTVTGNLTVPVTAQEPLASYQKVEGAVVEDLVTLPTQPCGIDFYKNRLVVSNYTTGAIYIYNTAPFGLMTTINTGLPGMMGVKVGPDGRIWCVNKTEDKVYRLDISAPATDLALTTISTPLVQNFKPAFFSTAFNNCTGTIVPKASILNRGTTNITSAGFQFTIDNGLPITHNWTGNLAPGSSTDVTFPSTMVSNGNHLLKIMALNVNGSPDASDLNNTVEGSFRTINPAVTFPFSETFTAAQFPPAGWNYVHYNPNNKMSRVSTGGFGLSTGCVKMDNFSGDMDITGQKDYLISPNINMSGAGTGARLRFSVAYAPYSAATSDELQVLASTDCGNTWTSIYSKSGATLSTAPANTSAWTPTNAEWRSDTVNMASFAGQSDLLLAFTTTSNFGNNLYIDDINVDQKPTGINEISFDDLMSAGPNPVSSVLHISFRRAQANDISGKIYAADGKLVKSFLVEKNRISTDLDLTELSSGLYSVSLFVGNDVYVKRIVKE